MIRYASLLCLIPLFMNGCAPPAKRQELMQEVLQGDPEFGQVLDKHKELLSRIQTYERELALKRSTIEHSISQLRRELSTVAASVKQKTDEVKTRMEPDRVRLTTGLTEAGRQLQTLRQQRASLGLTIAQRRKTLKSSSSAWTQKERTQQQAQLQELLREAERLDQEMTALKEHVRLLKIKLLLIKL